MPIAKFKCVREVSSEDSKFSAENLLKQDPGRKWKTKNCGEKSAYVIFELDKPEQIKGIDIGNEHSAFVEVLVSCSGCHPDNFTEILITCSFMTPTESKSSSNPNRVRCFNNDALVATVATKKWRLIKVICTQPFNKHIQYGLSFFKLHIVQIEIPNKNLTPKLLVPEKFLIQKQITKTKENAKGNEKTASNKTLFSKFALREESPDSDSESSAALFNRWKKSREVGILPTSAAAIRQASTIFSLKKSTESVKRASPIAHSASTSKNQQTEIRDRNRADLLFGAEEGSVDNEDKKLQRLSKLIEAEKEQLKVQSKLAKKTETKVQKSEKHSKQLENLHFETKHKAKDSSLNESINPGSSKKRVASPSCGQFKKLKSEITHEYRPFNQLLRGVVLVISGIQNPDRANLRGKALAMGAKYKADWEPGCTHLICAFKNTPKYSQVKGKGKIVKRAWIETCFDLKKYLPWRRYALDSDDEAKPESDSEILDETHKPLNKQNDTGQGSHNNVESTADKPFVLYSASDTDDDIERIMRNNKVENRDPNKNRDVYDVTTEEEDYIQQKTKQTKFVFTFFDNIKFFIDSDLIERKKYQLERCIKHYGGSITQKANEAEIFLTENIPEICKSGDLSGKVVRSQWIFDCNDMKQKLPMEPYIIAKELNIQ